MELGETEVGTTEIDTAKVGELIEAGAEIGLHQPGPPPEAGGGHHPAQAGAVQQRFTEVGPLQTRAGKVGLLPEGAPCPRHGEIGAPQEGPLEAAAFQIGAGEAGMAETGLQKTAIPEVAASQVKVHPIEIAEAEAGELPLAGGEGSAQVVEGAGQGHSHGPMAAAGT